MIRSMTGYGRAEAGGGRTILTVECKSVNHRHLDISIKLPRVLGVFEADARRLIQAALQRGLVDVSVTLSAPEGTVLNPLTVNLAQAREYADAARQLAEALDLPDGPTLGWVMGQSGVLTREEQTPLEYHEAEAALRALARRGFVAEGLGRSNGVQGRPVYAVPGAAGTVIIAVCPGFTSAISYS